MKDTISEAVWADILAHVRTDHAPAARGWFAQLRPLSLVGGELTIGAANAAQLTYLENHARQVFVEAAQAATGRLVSVSFVFDPAVGAAVAPVEREPLTFERENAVLRLSALYTFDEFVTGPCNQLAHASCCAVGENPGRAYNPLFIHGSVGLGKTHLLQAVCHRVLDHAPATRISYLSCETLANHFIEAVERGALHSFRYMYRNVDVLVVDDIQFLANRDRMQEEFFHTFNTLYQAQKQIILSADCMPAEIPSLEERLVSRFNWGLVTRIEAPCLDTRIAIVRKKAKLKGVALPDDAAMLIASRIKSNTRELEGAIARIQGRACFNNGIIDRNLVESALDQEVPRSDRILRIQDITSAVTEHFGIKLSDMQSKRRSRSVAVPRQICMYFARQLTRHSLEEIGGFFGGRDHTTVLHADRLIKRRRNEEPDFRARLEQIERTLSIN